MRTDTSWRAGSPRAFIASVGPQPRRLGLAGAWGQQRHGCIVSEYCLPRQHMPSDGRRQRLQQCRGFTDPIRQRRAIQIEPFAGEDLALPIKRQMVGILVDQHMRQQTWTRTPALDRARGQRRPGEAIAA